MSKVIADNKGSFKRAANLLSRWAEEAYLEGDYEKATSLDRSADRLRIHLKEMDEEATRLNKWEVLTRSPFQTMDDLLRDAHEKGNAPALCSLGCRVELDGKCPHGYRSIVRAIGLI